MTRERHARLQAVFLGASQRVGDDRIRYLDEECAGDPELRGGVRLAIRDADGVGAADLITGSGEGESSRLRVYLGPNLLADPSPDPDQDLAPFEMVLADGVFVG